MSDFSITATSFSPDGKSLLISNDFSTFLWDIEFDPRLIRTFSGGVAAFHPKGKILAIGDDNGTIYFKDIKTFRIVDQILITQEETVNIGDQISTIHEKLHDLSFSPDGKLLIIKFEHGKVIIWNIDKQQITEPL